MRRLTRSEIESGGCAMPRIMNFHDQLIGSRLMTVTRRRSDWRQPPPLLILDEDVVLAAQYDDEGNPGGTEWQVLDREGYMYRSVQVQDLCRKPVTAVGYFHDPDNDCRPVIPYVEFARIFLVCCMTALGGGVIFHQRPGSGHDLFCQLKPNIETQKETR